MRKRLPLISLLVIPFTATAQITLEESDIPAPVWSSAYNYGYYQFPITIPSVPNAWGLSTATFYSDQIHPYSWLDDPTTCDPLITAPREGFMLDPLDTTAFGGPWNCFEETGDLTINWRVDRVYSDAHTVMPLPFSAAQITPLLPVVDDYSFTYMGENYVGRDSIFAIAEGTFQLRNGHIEPALLVRRYMRETHSESGNTIVNILGAIEFYMDHVAYPPMASYRVVTRTVNGVNQYSKYLALEIDSSYFQTTAVPNVPALADIRLGQEQGRYELVLATSGLADCTVLSAEGRTVLQRTIVASAPGHREPLDLAGFSSGIYTVRLVMPNGHAWNGRIVKP